MIVRELLTKWGIKVNDKELKKFRRNIKKTRKDLKKLSERSIKIGKTLTTFVTLPILAAGAAMLKASIDAIETESKFKEVFKGLGDDSENMAKRLGRNFGLATITAKEMLSGTGDLLVGFGFARDKALDLSNQVSELSVDIASFKNVQGGATRASAAITKALLGERESLKGLGIAILEEDVKAKVLELRQQNITFETERQMKAFATLQIILERSKDSLGDYARTNKDAAGQVRIFQERTKSVAVLFGKVLIPTFNKILGVFIKFLEFLEDMDADTRSFIVTVISLVAVLGPLIFAFGKTITTIFILIKVLKLLGVASLLAQAKLLAIPLLVAAAFVALALLIEDIIAFFQGKKSLTAVVVREINTAIDFIVEKFGTLPGKVKKVMAGALLPVRALLNLLQSVGGALGAITGGDFSGALDAIKEGIQKTIKPNLGDFRSIIGLAGTRPTTGPAAPTPRAAAAGGMNQSMNIKVDAPISVPPGTPPEAVGPAIQAGVKAALDGVLRDTRAATKPQVAF